jgi:hypothetical protein
MHLRKTLVPAVRNGNSIKRSLTWPRVAPTEGDALVIIAVACVAVGINAAGVDEETIPKK